MYYSGYTFASLSTFLCFFLIYKEKQSMLFYMMALLAFFNLLLWVRNRYGLIWLVVFLALFSIIHYFQLTILQEIIVLLLSSVLLIESTLSSFSILTLSIRNSKQAGDASGLQKLTFIPAPIWGLLFFTQSLVCSYYIYQFFLK
ncbi:M50 family metallopeptidase [Halalkalibacter urbisdiaboli]|uniref:M50 family metallopeptidase n=1 Tax=Halalkalibacter urbisdiaboli TaxID=1960589 RepID=UPI003CC9D6A5